MACKDTLNMFQASRKLCYKGFESAFNFSTLHF